MEIEYHQEPPMPLTNVLPVCEAVGRDGWSLCATFPQASGVSLLFQRSRLEAMTPTSMHEHGGLT